MLFHIDSTGTRRRPYDPRRREAAQCRNMTFLLKLCDPSLHQVSGCPPSNLPTSTSALVGGRLPRLVPNHRLQRRSVTLASPGGSGPIVRSTVGRSSNKNPYAAIQPERHDVASFTSLPDLGTSNSMESRISARYELSGQAYAYDRAPSHDSPVSNPRCARHDQSTTCNGRFSRVRTHGSDPAHRQRNFLGFQQESIPLPRSHLETQQWPPTRVQTGKAC